MEDFINCMDWCSDSEYSLGYLVFLNEKDLFFNIDIGLINNLKLCHNFDDYSDLVVEFKLKPGITDLVDNILSLKENFKFELGYTTINRSELKFVGELSLYENEFSSGHVSFKFNATSVVITENTKLPTSYYSQRDK